MKDSILERAEAVLLTPEDQRPVRIVAHELVQSVLLGNKHLIAPLLIVVDRARSSNARGYMPSSGQQLRPQERGRASAACAGKT
jgi:hypothetical protein